MMKDETRTRLPPGPAEKPWLTAYHWIRRPLGYLDEQAERFGGAFTLRVPASPVMVVFSDPNAVKEIFLDSDGVMEAGKWNRLLAPFLGNQSLIVLDGKEHLRYRRLMMPPFHGERMQAYGRQMIELTDAVVDEWPLDRLFHIHPWMQTITMRVIVRTLFGVEAGPRFERFNRLLAEVGELGGWPPLLFPFMQVDLGRWSPWGKFLRKKAEVVHTMLDEIAMRRREGTAGRIDVLSLLLDARDETGAPMTDEELRDELITLVVAGYETSATMLSWTLDWILKSPDVERRLREEIEAASSGGGPTPERIAGLEYLDAVVREALRLSPIIPVIGRVLRRPATVGGYELHEGEAVVCSIYNAQRRAEAFPEPRSFRPERFLGTKITPYEFFPFGGGVRRCIGMAFAFYELKMILFTVLSRAVLVPSGKPVEVVRRGVTVTPSGGMPVILRSRKPARAR